MPSRTSAAIAAVSNGPAAAPLSATWNAFWAGSGGGPPWIGVLAAPVTALVICDPIATPAPMPAPSPATPPGFCAASRIASAVWNFVYWSRFPITPI